MLIRPRVIPILLIDNQSLVKTIKFSDGNYIGDPINATKIFNEKGVDELGILDISASRDNKGPDFKLLEEIATEAFMPLSYGGGVKTFEDAKRVLKIGYEKIIFNTAILDKREVLYELINYAGSQSVVASIDYRKNIFGKKTCYVKNGQIKTKHTPIELAKELETIGVGEIMLNCIDRDGTMMGYDLDTIKEISQNINVPVVACGGAGGIKDLKNAIFEGHASAVAAGSMFVYYGKKKAVLINVPDEKELIKEGIYYER